MTIGRDPDGSIIPVLGWLTSAYADFSTNTELHAILRFLKKDTFARGLVKLRPGINLQLKGPQLPQGKNPLPQPPGDPPTHAEALQTKKVDIGGMKLENRVSQEVLDLLKRYDTPTVSNAIESFNVRTRHEGHVSGRIQTAFPLKASLAGYAVPGRIRTAAPPIAGRCYYDRIDFWEYVANIPAPKIVVLEDIDHSPGIGALFGEIHAHIARALDCVAFITNGTVRDVPALQKMNFPCFAQGTSVSHSYAHIVEFGAPVEIGGLKISEGDLLQADLHGVLAVPVAIADRLESEIARLLAREADLIAFCNSANSAPDPRHALFLDNLKQRLEQGGQECQPQTRFYT